MVRRLQPHHAVCGVMEPLIAQVVKDGDGVSVRAGLRSIVPWRSENEAGGGSTLTIRLIMLCASCFAVIVCPCLPVIGGGTTPWGRPQCRGAAHEQSKLKSTCAVGSPDPTRMRTNNMPFVSVPGMEHQRYLSYTGAVVRTARTHCR